MENAETVHFGQLERSEYEKISLSLSVRLPRYPKEHTQWQKQQLPRQTSRVLTSVVRTTSSGVQAILTMNSLQAQRVMDRSFDRVSNSLFSIDVILRIIGEPGKSIKLKPSSWNSSPRFRKIWIRATANSRN